MQAARVRSRQTVTANNSPGRTTDWVNAGASVATAGIYALSLNSTLGTLSDNPLLLAAGAALALLLILKK